MQIISVHIANGCNYTICIRKGRLPVRFIINPRNLTRRILLKIHFSARNRIGDGNKRGSVGYHRFKALMINNFSKITLMVIILDAFRIAIYYIRIFRAVINRQQIPVFIGSRTGIYRAVTIRGVP